MKLACLVSVLQLTSGNQIFASGKFEISGPTKSPCSKYQGK